MTPLGASKAMYAHVACGEWDCMAEFMAEDFVIHEPGTLPYGANGAGATQCNGFMPR